jgi:hypothetical protein
MTLQSTLQQAASDAERLEAKLTRVTFCANVLLSFLDGAPEKMMGHGFTINQAGAVRQLQDALK